MGLGLAIAIAIPLIQPLVLGQSLADQRNIPSTEIRGTWLTNIDSEVLFSRQRLRKAFHHLRQLNFNTVYPTVWNGGYTLYPSAVAEQVVGRSLDPAPGLQGRDILAEMVEQGDQEGLAVIPWLEFGFMAPANSALARRHPDWLSQRQDGSLTWQEGTEQRVWLNPVHPQVQRFILDLIAEVSRYDVEGIQLDDHFGLPVDFGYDPLTVKLYQQQHQGHSPPDNAQDPEWRRWRADQITNLMGQIFQTIKAQNPNCLVVLAPNPQPFAYTAFLQDWQTWERRGLVEELILQVYRDQLSSLITALERPEVQAARSHIPAGVGLLTGLNRQPVPIKQIQNQVQAVRNRGFAGVSFFYYETLWNRAAESSEKRQAAFQALFPQPVPRSNRLQTGIPSAS